MCPICFNSVKVTELPPVWDLGLSTAILLFVKIRLFIFPFVVWDKFWVLIRPVPEVFLQIFKKFASRFSVYIASNLEPMGCLKWHAAMIS